MKNFKLFILVVLLLILNLPSFAGEKGKIRFQCQIFRIMNDIRGETSLEKKVWTTKDPPEALKNIVTVFDKGNFKLGGHSLELNSKGLFWDNKEIYLNSKGNNVFPNDLIWEVASPEIILKNKSQMSLKVNSKQPLQYFTKFRDNLYELKKVQLPTGVDLDLWAELEGKDRILLTDLVLTLKFVAKREDIEGTDLRVGYPILESKKYTFYFRVKSRKDYGILIKPVRGQGVLFIRFRATRI